MNVVAHQDDDLIFQNPDLLEAISAGVCVRTVFVTAGDAGLGEAYWREREEGSRAAYAVMAGVANNWTKTEATVAGHTLHVATLTGKPTVSQVYMRLPNGGSSGAGYPATGFKSLPKLWRSHNPEPASLTPISELSALDGSATYTYEGLLGTLEALIAEFEPEIISTQNFSVEFGTGDHGDHIAVAKLTRIAANAWTKEHVLRGYMDYETKNFPVNVFEPALAKKLNAYYAYAAHDSNEACTSQAKCEEPFYSDYWAWLKRQIVVSETSVPGANAGPDQAVASKAAVTLDGSGSSDPLGHALSYEWKQTGGTAVTLSSSKAVKPTFTAPTGPASLTFSLVVKSSEASSQPDSVTVSVAAPKFALKVTRSGNGSGTVTSSPAGIECGSDCEESYEQGTKVTLTPSPAAGSEFKGWSGACSGTGACEVTVSAAKSVGAEFTLQRHQLSVSKTGSGSGTVASSPVGLECGSTCTANFNHGSLVKLTGTPGANSKAVVWETCPGTVNASNQCEVTMSGVEAATARFDLEPRQLTVAKNGSGTGAVTSSPAGISCGSECQASFSHGTLVKLTGTPGANTKAVVWESCPGTVNASNQCEVTMSAAKEAKATFNLEQRQLSISKAGSGSGTVTSSPAGINCGSECSASFNHGTLLKLTGTPAAGSKAVSWSGCDAVNGSNQCEVTMSAVKTVTATFNLEQHQLTVVDNGSGSGTVTSSPAGIECGATCAANLNHGTLVKLTGTPAAGSKAVAWSGCDAVNGSNQCEVTMSATRKVEATFTLESHLLSVEKKGTGSGTVTSSPAGINCGSECATSYDHGTEVTLSQSPAAGSEFKGWSGACSGTGTCKVTMSAAKSVGGEFAPAPKFALKVTRSGNGSGTVTSAPAGIECGSDCEESYEQGTKVTLTPSPAAGSEFKGWSGACSGTGACEVTVSAAKSVGAEFTLQRHQLSLSKAGSGSGTVTSSPAGISCGSECGASYDHGTLVKLSGTPAAGSKAVSWSGCDAVNGSNECEVTMSAARDVTATFDLEPRQLTVIKNGSGTGTVTSSPAGINCGSECSASFLHGTLVKLAGAPGPNSKAVVWETCPGTVNASNQCEVTMSAVKEAKATFNLESHQLTVVKNGSGTGTVTSSPAGIGCGSECSASFSHGVLVTLTGAPGANTKAVVWQACPGTVNASNQCEVTMSAAKEVKGTFSLEQRQLTVERTGSGSGTVTSAPAGIECGATCAASYDHGTLVKLTGTPGANAKAVVWETCPGTVNASNQCEVAMSAAKEAVATFDLEQRQLTVVRNGLGTGTVTSSPAGINCGSECSASYDHGTLVKLTGTPGANSKAVAWQACPGTVNASNQCEVTMSAAKEAKATFSLEQRQLTVERTGSGSGTVTSAPAGIECGATCAASFNHGTLVKLTGTPAAGSKAVSWSGCDAVNGSNQCEVTMSAAKAVSATFDLESHQLTVVTNGSGTGSVTSSPAGISCGSECGASYDHGTLVKLTGAPGPNSKAVVWQACPGTVNASNQCEVTMSAAKEAVATFDLEQRQLTVFRNGSGTGAVTSAPAGIECGATCAASFNHGTLVTLTGAPGANTKAVVWQACPGTVNASNQCEVTMSAAKEAKATFSLEQRQLTVERTGSGSGTVTSAPAGIECGATCAASFNHGTLVKLTGTPATGSKAVAWSGCDKVNGSNECEVTMSTARKVEATFTLESHQLSVEKKGTGSGAVTSAPAGIECGATCAASFDYGTEVTLSATPDANSKAAVWESCPGTVNASNQCEVTMSAAKEAKVTFDLGSHLLSVERKGTGSGTVTSAPAGIECGSTCSASLVHGTVVKLAATSATDSEPAAWGGCDAVNASNECEVTMSAARDVTATFTRKTPQLSVALAGSGSGTVTSFPAGIECGSNCGQSYDYETLVKLAGSSSEGSRAVVWGGCDAVNGSNECEVTMVEAKDVTATFSLADHYSLAVVKVGSGSGTVTATPAGIECGSDCSHEYKEGTLVKLAGSPGAGSKAVVWQACPGTVNASNECEVTMSEASNAVATFGLESHLLTVERKGNGSGAITSAPVGIDCASECAASFDHGTEVTLQAVAAGTETIAWSGCDEIVAGDKCRVSMDADKEVSATLNSVETPPIPDPTPPPPPGPPATPKTKLLKAEVARGKAMFAFTAQGGAARFHCALAKVRKELTLKYKRCTSPTTYRDLSPGRYVFKVKAIGPDGADTTPATRHFRVRAS